MAYLGTPSATKEIINKYSFAFQKKFGLKCIGKYYQRS